MPETKKITKEKSRHFFTFGLGKEIDNFLENLAALLSAGIPILEALSSIREESRVPRLRKIIKEMEGDIEVGKSLSDTLEKSGLFSAHVSALIRMGEKSGKLVDNLKIIATEERKKRNLSSKIRSAAMYPAFVMSLTVIIGIGIAWFILPKLSNVFLQLKVQLPTVTRILIDTGQFLDKHGYYVVPSAILLVAILMYFVFVYSKTRIIGEYILFLLPGAKTLLQQTEISRFGYLLGTLLSAGLSPTEALTSLSEATSLIRYKRLYLFLAKNVSEGNSFKKSFSLYKNANKLLTPSIQQLVIAAEQSGSLSTSLIKISETYEAKTDITAKDLAVMLEPILLVIVWLGVVAVALAVILPIYSLVGQLNSGPVQ